MSPEQGIKTTLAYAVSVGLAAYMLLQARKPTKWFGRIFLRLLNQSHSSLTGWGLKHVAIGDRFTILDVGCGGGKTVNHMAASATNGMVYGIDYSEGSVAASRSLNRSLIEAGRVVIEKASVSQLPFPASRFDLVTAIETQYYWPNLVQDMREILRVLKPEGKLVVIAEMYKGGKHDKLKWPAMWLLRSSHLSAKDHRELLAKAGYSNIEIFEELDKGWICVIGGKAAAADVVQQTSSLSGSS